MKKRIAHIVPSMAIGGVEVAVQRSLPVLNAELDYRIFYVRRKGVLQCGQEPVWRLFWYVLCGHWRPDVVITSLWWSHAMGWLLLASKVKWAAFFHNSGYSHIVDRLLLKWAWKRASHRIVDSFATETAMRLVGIRSATRVPYVFPTRDPMSPWEARTTDFVWVGRVSAVKRIDLLVEFLNLAESYFPQGRVVIVLAGQETAQLAEFVRRSGMSIRIKNNLPNAEILMELSNAKFYLLFSDHEGMSMSTVEAVQAGCVAVVRRVGEIPSYLDEAACVSVQNDSLAALGVAARSVDAIARDSNAVEVIRGKALDAICRIPYYSETLIATLKEISRS